MALSVAIVLQVSAAYAEADLKRRTWMVDGTEREALIYAPAQASSTPSPVVFAFHGHGGTMAHAARSFAYHVQWPEAFVVYMQGLKTPGKLTDPEGKRTGWQHGPGDQDDRDLKFFDAVLASLRADYQVDQRRIYSTGHSNGGGFTYLLWGHRGDIFAAMAPSSATPGKDWRSLKPKPALHLAGENDALVKYEWQKLAIDGVRRLNGDKTTGQRWDQAGNLIGTIYHSDSPTPFVTLIHPGGHQFPSEAPALIVKFFKAHSKPQDTK